MAKPDGSPNSAGLGALGVAAIVFITGAIVVDIAVKGVASRSNGAEVTFSAIH